MAISSSGAVTSTGTIGGSNSATLATTGSNTFTGQQYISNTNAPVNFTDTASLYTDGGLRVGKDAYVSGTLYLNNLTVFGTQSVNFITSSQLDISDNIITVNTSTPAIRFGGIAVRDSGSASGGSTGSLLWDSQDNQWLYSNPSGSEYDSALLLVGPRNYGALGTEVGITTNALAKGDGFHHMTSSGIFESGSNVGIGTSSPSYKLDVQGTGRFTGALTGSSATFSGTSNSGVKIKQGAQIGNPVTLSDFYNGLTLENNSSTNAFALGYTSGGTFSISSFNGSSTYTKLLTISNGNVGIGEDNPSELLVLKKLTYPTIKLIESTASASGYFQYHSDSSEFRLLSITNHPLIFSTYDSEKMRITAGGNVGIGTNDPSQLLHLVKAQNATTTLLIQNTADGSGAAAELRFYGNVGAGSLKNNQQISFVRGSGGVDWAIGQVANSDDFAICGGTNQGDGKPSLTTAERIRITSGGNVLIGTTSDDGVKLAINGNAAINDQQFRWRTGGDANHATRFDTDTNGPFTYGYFGAALGYVSDGPQRRTIWTNTTNAYNYQNSTSWQTTSDIRIKENIRPISEALNKICALNPTHFEFKTRLGITKTGFIAQEFEQIFPNHVTEIEPNGEYAEYFEKGEKIKSIDADLIPYLVKAIQEQQAQINELKAQING
jgi:hypothetical protein